MHQLVWLCEGREERGGSGDGGGIGTAEEQLAEKQCEFGAPQKLTVLLWHKLSCGAPCQMQCE